MEDESRWIAVEHAKIFRNKPSELTFFVPTSLVEGVKYRVRVETSYLSKGKSRKETLAGESEVVMLKA